MASKASFLSLGCFFSCHLMSFGFSLGKKGLDYYVI